MHAGRASDERRAARVGSSEKRNAGDDCHRGCNRDQTSWAHEAHVTLRRRERQEEQEGPGAEGRTYSKDAKVKPLIIAIDGPSGAGKGTVARAVAAQLQYRYLDSGAMYRAVAWKAIRTGVSLDDEAAVAHMAADSRIDVTGTLVSIDGHDVARVIRTPEIDRAAAAVARLPAVRAILVERQRRLGSGGRVVMEGRDIGTVVFPNADVKIYLDALPEERARRRATDPAHSARAASVSDVVTALAARDELDRTRAASPLYAAEDAVVIDTTGKPVDEVVRRVMDVVRGKLRA
jgi:cytidylate kinase